MKAQLKVDAAMLHKNAAQKQSHFHNRTIKAYFSHPVDNVYENASENTFTS